MKSFFCTTVLFFFFSNCIWAQAPISKNMKGKVVSNAVDLEGIYIINLKTEASTASGNGGYFEIRAMIGDTLMFSAVQIKGKKVVVKESDFQETLFFVKLEGMINQLEEVKIIKYNNINAVALGIIPKGQKTYTPAERKLYTATTGSGILPIDPIINWLSGRTAMLKNEIEVEKKEFLLRKIEDLFETSFFTDKLKIPTENVKAFYYYIVEDSKFVEAMNNKNKTMATFVLGDLAVEYLKLNGIEK
jgi:hypothetical protein